MENQKLSCYRSLLPHGTIKVVAERAGVTTQSVRNYLNGRNNSVRIENAILEVLADLKAKRNSLLKEAGLSL